MTSKYTQNEFELAIKESYSLNQVCEKLGLFQSNGNRTSIKKRIHKLNLNIDHFYSSTNTSWMKGKKSHNTKTLQEFLVLDSNITSSHLRNKLIKEKIFEHKCYQCNNSIWNNKPIPIQLHHINGQNTDNRLENLTILCPNCHAQTDNYSSKNVKMQITTSKKLICECGSKKTNAASSCYNCYSKNRRFKKVENRPSKDELLILLSNHSISSIGRQYKVNGNTIRKWCKNYNLPFKTQEIKAMLTGVDPVSSDRQSDV
jgi:Zn finger protein HypA/HybF involved in hydrogenase expression